MTRLQVSDFSDIPGTMAEFDFRLRRQTGLELRRIAARAAGMAGDPSGKFLSGVRVAAITMTCGEGRLGGFAEAVASIAGYLGTDAFVPSGTDAAGLAEACESGAKIVMLADEDRFVAIHLRTRRVSDNSEMTGRAFATALDLMASGLQSRKALVLGCGPVGRAAVAALRGYGASVTVFDRDVSKSRALASGLGETAGAPVLIAPNLPAALSSHEYILDATPAGAFIGAEWIEAGTILVSPGVPCGATEEAAAQLGERLLFDPLRLGTAAMLMDALRGEEGNAVELRFSPGKP